MSMNWQYKNNKLPAIQLCDMRVKYVKDMCDNVYYQWIFFLLNSLFPYENYVDWPHCSISVS